MTKLITGTLISSMLVMPMSGCQSMGETGSGAAIGAVAGGLLGAGAGAMAGGHHKGRDAAIGAGVGALAGAAIGGGIGYYLQKKRERLQQVQNVQVAEVPAVQPAQGPAVAEHISVRIGAQFLFEANSATLSPGGIAKIREIAATLSDDQNSRVIVKGYTSSEGGDAVNIPLSQNRANAVKNILMAERIDGARITALGMGSMEPIGDNGTLSGQMMNRRVEIEVYQR